MKKKITILLSSCFVVCLLFTFKSANAQGKIGVNGLVPIPTGDFKQVAGTGYGININPMFFLGPNVALGLTAGYQNYSEEISGLKYSIIPLTFDGEFYFTEKRIRPYLGIAGGAFIVTTKISTFSNKADVSSEGHFGIAPKAGFLINLSNQLGLNIASKYQLIFLEQDTWASVIPEIGLHILIAG